MIEMLKTLSNLDGISGREDAVRAYILEQIKKSPAQMQTQVDALGNIICKISGKARADKHIMLAAHMDEVGFIITDITDDGYLRFATVGGIDPSVICGKRVKIGENKGVIGCKAVHLCNEKEKDTLLKPENLLIDIGVSSKAEAQKLVKIGDSAVFDTTAAGMQDLLIGKAFDDRVGCALLLELLKEIPPYDVTFVFTVQEEVGLRGAGVAAFAVQPDMAIVIDATTAADTADTETHNQVCKIDNGPVVSFMDKATLYDAEVYQKIRALADAASIPNQTKTVIAGGNDAGAIQKAASGVRVAAVSLPCRYIHSPNTVISQSDMQHTKALLQRILQEFGHD